MEHATIIDRRRRLAAALWTLADLTAVSERQSFRSRAYREGAWALDLVPNPFDVAADDLVAVEGIGPGIATLIREFSETDRLTRLDQLVERLPVEAARMAGLPRMNSGRLQTLKASLGVDTVSDLMDAIHIEAVETLEGIGPATADRWLEILSLPPSPGALPAHAAAVLGQRLQRHLIRLSPHPSEVWASGALRRLEEWVPCIELVVISDQPEALVPPLAATAAARSATVADGSIGLVLHDGTPASITPTRPGSAGTVLLATTGPPDHVRAMNPMGSHADETAVYAAIGHVWIPPPARGDQPVDASGLVRLEDVRGDLHLHTDRSPDGRMSLEEAVEAAITRGYDYLAVTDHTAGLGFGGLDAGGLADQRRDIERVRRRFPGIAIFHGAEINIDREGRPDLDDDVLERLDFVVAGCHSHFDLERDQQTARLVRAVSHPAVRVLAHPTGRRIGIRRGFDADLGQVFEAAVAHRTALEVNGHRDRMDLSAANAAEAVAAGVMLAADGDAHRLVELENMAVAVGVMQKALVSPGSIVNCLPRAGFEDWIAR